MFGREFSTHPDILLESFRDMHEEYRHRRNASWFQSLYIRLFGIPEIGYQVRCLYFRYALQKIPLGKRAHILDMGSGIGGYLLYLARAYPNASITGWEIDEKKIAISKQLMSNFGLSNVSIRNQDITKTNIGKNTYDFILTIDVLEHVREYKKALAGAKRLLKPGGYLYIHVPQMRQRRLFSRFRTWTHSDHVREGFDPGILKQELTDLGFHIVLMRNTFGFFGSLAWELNHMTLVKNTVLAGLLFPIIWLIARVDIFMENKRGLGISVLVKKLP